MQVQVHMLLAVGWFANVIVADSRRPGAKRMIPNPSECRKRNETDCVLIGPIFRMIGTRI